MNGHRCLPDIQLIQFFCFRSQQRGASTKNEVIRERDYLVFFPVPTSKLIQMPTWTVGGKPTCEIEANPNSNIVLLDMWQRNSRQNHGSFNVFQCPIFPLALWKIAKKDNKQKPNQPWSLRGLPSRSLLRRDPGFVDPADNTTHTMSRIFTTILRSADMQSW